MYGKLHRKKLLLLWMQCAPTKGLSTSCAPAKTEKSTSESIGQTSQNITIAGAKLLMQKYRKTVPIFWLPPAITTYFSSLKLILHLLLLENSSFSMKHHALLIS